MIKITNQIESPCSPGDGASADEALFGGSATAAATAALALGILILLYLLLALDLAGVTGKRRDLAIFIAGGGVIPAACAALLSGLGRRRRLLLSARSIVIAARLATLALAALTLITLANALPLAGDWASRCRATIAAIALLQLLLQCGSSLPLPEGLKAALAVSHGERASVGATNAAFAMAVSIALPVIFWIPAGSSFAPPFLSLFSDPPFDPSGGTRFLAAFLLALLGLAVVVILGAVEHIGSRRFPNGVRIGRRVGLGVAIALLPLLFDFSLPAEALHHLTNVAPALQLRSGGVLMVDTFSQYGPGPVLATLLWMSVLQGGLPAANVGVQMFNLSFYAVWLICLYRLSPLRLPALVLGLFAIVILMGWWGVGNRNINFAPSILGMRYLPALLMVLAISYLRPPATMSIWTAAAAFVATLWSVEMTVGVITIHLATIAFAAMKDRAWSRLCRDGLLALSTPIVALLCLSAYAWIYAGEPPKFGVYLGYLSTYNPASSEWGISANPLFFGWAPVLSAVFLVLVDAWRRSFGAQGLFAESASTMLLRFVPMAVLCLLMSAYFVGRSVEYTIIIALLPFAALVIPAALQWCVFSLRPVSQARLALLLLPALAVAYGLAFAIAGLSRTNAQYTLYAWECAHHGRCSFPAIASLLKERLAQRPVIDRTGRSYSDAYFDSSGAVGEAVDLLQRLQPDRTRAVVLLGPVLNIPIVRDVRDDIASDAALLYAGKWHRWPRSYTFADGLVPERVDQILAAPVSLDEGELVLVRRNEALLGALESGILRLIRSKVALCEVKSPAIQVAAYRVSLHGVCA